MHDRSWFWRTFGFWMAPDKAGTFDREDWARVQRISHLGNTRRFRRFAVLLWIGMLAFDPWMIFHLARLYAPLAMLPQLLLPTATQLLITWLAFRGMRIGLAQPTLDDSAMMQHGVEFDELTSKQREQLFQQRSRDFIFGGIYKDEREAELRLHAEGAAYRLLRPGLVLIVAAYWTVCLLGPFEAVRETLTITAIAVTWIAVAVLVLPTMVRMWTQPNEAGETRIVATGKKAE
jgi:hypothetical protein